MPEEPKEKKLFHVTVSIEAEADCYVWAYDSTEANEVAKDEIDLDLFDGDKSSYGNPVTLADLKKVSDLDERPYGECPPEMPVGSIRMGDTLRDALAWMERGTKAKAAYLENMKAQVPLFEGLAPMPLPCEECGKRAPIEPHLDDCVNKD